MTTSRYRRTTAWLVAALVGIAFIVAGAAQGESTRASDDVHVAGIVVDYGDGEMSYALVPFTEDTISGIELLHRSGLSLLTVEFGSMGEGVCTIEQTGCDLSACRARMCQTGDSDSPFWQYARSSDEGEWQFAPLGASSSQIVDGDVNGWFWTGSTPAGEAMSVELIAAQVDVDLDSIRSGDSDSLDAITTTSGDDDSGDSAIEPWNVIAGVAILGAVLAVGGFAVVRARKMAPR